MDNNIPSDVKYLLRFVARLDLVYIFPKGTAEAGRVDLDSQRRSGMAEAFWLHRPGSI